MLIITMGLFFITSCNSKSSKKTDGSEDFHQFDIREKIPDRIKSVNNLSTYPGDAEAPYSVKLIEKEKFGEKGEPFIAHLYSCVVDGRGRVIVRGANSSYEQQLFVFNADGTFRTKLGRHGKGPGEYGVILNVYAKNNTIYVQDYTSKRMNEYSTSDYTYQRTTLTEQWKAPENFKFAKVKPRSDGNYQLTYKSLGPKSGVINYLIMAKDDEGKKVNVKPHKFPVGYNITTSDNKSKVPTPTMPVSFLGSTITALSPNDELYADWSRDFLIKKYDSTGTYQSAIYYPIKGVPFNLAGYVKSATFSPDASDIEDGLSANGVDLPDRLPVVTDLMVDDEQRIWVALPTSSKRDTYEWWILKNNGELLAKLTLPKKKRIFDIKNGFLYSKKTNKETDIEYIVKYRIALTKK